LRTDSDRNDTASWHLHRASPERGPSWRPTRGATDKVRACHQPQDRQGARPPNFRQAARECRRGDRMRRREFIMLIGGAAAATRPLAARAQQSDRVRRIGVLLPTTADDVNYQAWLGAFHQGLAKSGWIIGRNVRIDTHWAGNKADEIRRRAAELV